MGNSLKLDRIGFVTLQANKNRPSLFISILFSRDSLEVTNIETLFPELLQSMCKPKDPISDNYHLPITKNKVLNMQKYVNLSL